MAELTEPTPTAHSSCCSSEAQSSCCEPAQKEDCCAAGAGGGRCGCSAGRGGPTAPADVRETVREKYAAAACQAAAAEDWTDAEFDPDDTGRRRFGGTLYGEEGAEAPAAAVNASLGCGVPTAVADLHEGETVLDLGSGAGADVLISARRVGSTGKAIGLDMTDEMLALARRNAAEAGARNVEFVKGYIEEIPLPDESVDVIVSNCVLNLSGDKPKVLREAARVLRPGGRFAVSDVIADPDMDDATRADMAQWTGCIAGALTDQEFRDGLAAAGLTDVEIRATHRVHEFATAAIIRARKPASDPSATTVIRTARPEDGAAIAEIYNAAIAERQATFETEPVGEATAKAWLGREREPMLVAERSGRVVGWARTLASEERCSLSGVGEYAIYLDPDARGSGIGRPLLSALVRASELAGYWKLLGRMFTTNMPSIALARRCGFREVGVYQRHGRLGGRWVDLLVVERLLDLAQRDHTENADGHRAVRLPA
jgi:L-amino acid N-acyltransferase YncA/ubiquinone/menaquinone biosynthesis C-methylase UbiE